MTDRPAPSRLAVGTNLGIVWVIWGSTYLAIGLMIQSAQPLWGMGVRFVAASLLLALGLAVLKGPGVLQVPWREAASAGALGILMLGSGIGVVALAERYVPTGVAGLLAAAVPGWAVLLRTITGERPHGLTWLGIVIGLLGVALLIRPDAAGMTPDRLLWSLLIVAGQMLFATGSFLTPKLPTPRDPLVLVTYEMVIGGLMFFVWSRVMGESVNVATITPGAWAAIGYLTASAIVGYSAYVWLLTHVSLSLAMTYAYVNPVVAVSLGWLVLHEQITWAIVLGGTVTLVGVALVVMGERSVNAQSQATLELEAVDSR